MKTNSHLSESALHDLLIGPGSAADQAHLDACALCAEKVASFRSDVAWFNQTTLAWSEARPARQNLTAVSRVARRPFYLSPLPWGIVTAAVLLAVGLAIRQHKPAVSPAPALIASTANENSAEQIAQDNELLRSVNTALEASEEPSVFSWTPTAHSGRPSSQRPETRNR